MARHEDIWRWRKRASGAVADVVHQLKETYGSPYYVPERHGSPWQSVRLADEVADEAISGGRGESWEEFRDAVCRVLQTEREGFAADDLSDPDGYVCGSLREFIVGLHSAGQTKVQRVPIAWAIAMLALLSAPLLALGIAVFFAFVSAHQ